MPVIRLQHESAGAFGASRRVGAGTDRPSAVPVRYKLANDVRINKAAAGDRRAGGAGHRVRNWAHRFVGRCTRFKSGDKPCGFVDLDLFQDVVDRARGELLALGFPASKLRQGDDLVIDWRHATDRIPMPAVWTVKESRQLAKTRLILSASDLQGLNEVRRKAEAGEPLRPHLSRQSLKPDYVDKMLAEWNITHFHLGTQLLASGLVQGTSSVLAAVIDPGANTLYFIDVQPHGGFWTRKEFLEIIEANWPFLNDPYVLNGIQVTANYTDQDHAGFRDANNNVLTLLSTGRPILGAGGGLTTAGTSAKDQRWLNHARRQIKWMEDIIRSKPLEMEARLKAAGVTWDETRFRLDELGDTAAVLEETTRTRFVIR